MNLAVFIQSSVAVGLTSAVPLLIFFLVGPLLCTNGNRSILLAGLVSLAAGSLLGDVFFHLIPEIFNLRDDYLRNCALMLLGVFVFFVGERVLQHYHHGHGHEHMETQFAVLSDPELNVSDLEEVELEVLSGEGRSDRTLSPRNKAAGAASSTGRSAKPVGLLVLTSDFIHNFVDGLAIGVSFATSFPVGLSTAVAVFLHEIPHELGDFAILLSAGYTPTAIVICNILTTLSSFLGVAVALVLIAVKTGAVDAEHAVTPFASTIKPAILSLTAGNFLYIALADLVPELLQSGQRDDGTESSALHRWIPFIQYASFLFGALAMLLIKIFSD